MEFWNNWAVSWRNGRLIGGLLLIPVVYGLFSIAKCTLSDRQTVVLHAPDQVTVFLDGDAIPQKSATNYNKEGRREDLRYVFDIDEGTYQLRVVGDDPPSTLEQPLVIDLANGAEIELSVLDGEGGLAIDGLPRVSE